MADIFNKAFINKVKKNLEELAIDRMDAVAMRAHARLVTSTPVDLGQARASWNFTLNEMSTFVPERPSSGEGRLAAPKSVPNAKARSISDVYHITNAAPHIIYLNEGSSEKAPAKFIEREIAQAIKDVSSSGNF